MCGTGAPTLTLAASPPYLLIENQWTTNMPRPRLGVTPTASRPRFLAPEGGFYRGCHILSAGPLLEMEALLRTALLRRLVAADNPTGEIADGVTGW